MYGIYKVLNICLGKHVVGLEFPTTHPHHIIYIQVEKDRSYWPNCNFSNILNLAYLLKSVSSLYKTHQVQFVLLSDFWVTFPLLCKHEICNAYTVKREAVVIWRFQTGSWDHLNLTPKHLSFPLKNVIILN